MTAARTAARRPGFHRRPSSCGLVAVDLAMVSEHARRVASLCASIATGLEVWAKHAKDDAPAARDLAIEHRDIVEDALRIAQASRPGVRTCERMRWEWLLSTGSLIDGTPASMFKKELESLEGDALEAASAVVRAGGASALRDRIARSTAAVAKLFQALV
jgi:hypothetical protein